jgi:hypothetical protein
MGHAFAPAGHPTSTRALGHAKSAAGRKQIRKGFAFDADMDLWFALGWPHFVTLVHDLPIDKKPVAAASEFFGYERSYVPARVAHGMARVHEKWAFSSEWNSKLQKRVPNAWAKKQLKRKEDVTADEAREMLVDDRAPDRDLVLLLEALVGPKVVVDAMTRMLEARDEDYFTEENIVASDSLRVLQVLLLRLAAEDEATARKRLTKVLHGGLELMPRKRLPTDAGERTPLNGLALALHGAAAAKKWELANGDYEFLSGAPSWLRKKLAAWAKSRSLHGSLPDPRRIFLAGAAQLQTEAELWMKYRAGAADSDRYVVETYGTIRSPHVVPLMLDMYARSNAKVLAKDWFIAHADYAAKHVEKAAKGNGKLAKAAKDISKAIA